jgi:nucleotide-binding universal stress UspA family protein
VYARLLGARLRVAAAAHALDAARRAAGKGTTLRAVRLSAEELVGQARRPGVRLVVLGAAPDAGSWAGALLEECPCPVLVLPAAGLPHATDVARVLVPLDGTAESAAAVEETVDLFAATGIDTVVLHVFDSGTTPSFWDQAAHARRSWGEEFLVRNLGRPDARLEVRAGSPGQEVLAAAEAERADLIALAWSQHLAPGRAATVRRALSAARIPVLLVPTGPSDSGGGS